jgi:16S rRNA (guanine(1405)-N(7))-methyltransferase
VALAAPASASVRPSDLDSIVAGIHQSRKYRDLCPATIRDVVAIEFDRHRKTSDAIAAARLKLHRINAEFLGSLDYERHRTELDGAFASGSVRRVELACRAILEQHASTRERLDDMTDFYTCLFAISGVPTRILDLASACHPFGFRWMGLPRSARYLAFDINARLVDLTNHYFQLEGIDGRAEHRDVLCDPPSEPADLALLLKMYHCLERRRDGAGWQVVSAIPARWVAISFPTRNLRQKRAPIRENYESQIRADAEKYGWKVQSFEVPSEFVLVVQKA